MAADFSNFPRVDRLLCAPEIEALEGTWGRKRTVALIREVLDEARRDVLAGGDVPSEEAVVATVLLRSSRLSDERTRRVINATGVLLHTNLGRAGLSERAVAALAEGARGSLPIELDLETGKRGPRARSLLRLLGELTGAEAALAVNNCAAAVLLMLAATCGSRKVIVSRGELIEIGGGFRVPEVMRASGAVLVEVGTTNKTHVADYERALVEHPDAAAVLTVHQGNFLQTGFVARPTLAELREVATRRGVLLLNDLGGGALFDFEAFGLHGEPTVQEGVSAGCDLVAFSADKALGGPQAGILVGRSDSVERCRVHPLARALRLGRLPQIALEATLESYALGRELREIPLLERLSVTEEALESRVLDWRRALAERAGISSEMTVSRVEVGGGTLAGRSVPSRALTISGSERHRSALRTARPLAVIARVAEGQVHFDARTVLPDEDEALLRAIVEVWAHPSARTD